MKRRPALVVLAVAVVCALLAGGLWWHAGADARAVRELSTELYARCVAAASSSTTPDPDAALARCEADRAAMLGR